eukprot:TRINITY_DN33529_c0_g1_i1.p1 TRINITY_DN33529_c0_g1~~TRINITY_DN33529_c0_g1_i1.p1  ORF type:complete len:927 (+),score=197.65 TRINITY_DN33529_c0_g1_i1:118-2898(+)
MASALEASHVCTYCKSRFPSKNKLFLHLRNSSCTAQAASDGLEVGSQLEKVAVIFGVASHAPDWRELLWQAIDAARGVGSMPGRLSYAARGGAMGAAFSSDCHKAIGVEEDLLRACDVLSLCTEVVATEEERRAWCAKANAVLPEHIQVLGRSCGLVSDFHAQRCCFRRYYVCFVPMQLLLVGTGDSEDAQDGLDATSAADCTEQSSAIIVPRQHVKEQHQPGWGEGEDGEKLLGQFYRLKQVLRRLQGEHLFHNFSQSKVNPRDAAARRHVYRCRALTHRDRGVTAFSVSADSLPSGQLRAMVGLAVALQHGLVSERYLDAVFGEEALLPVPLVPEGTQYLAGCIFRKDFHHLLQPLLESTVARAFQQRVEAALEKTALNGTFESWFQSALMPQVPSMLASLAPSAREHTEEETPAVYADVLKLLREAACSGRWPGISKGREKVIKDSTLAENGGEGGSFTVGSMPPPLEEPAGNRLFPELARCAFELERSLRPNRAPSSTIAINKRAQFLPHVDSGAGAGQGISLIVGLGDYCGGELVVEGTPHDIRYKPLDFNGWTQRHWTQPFEGERFSLVWFTPVGCENLPGLKVCGHSSKEAVSEPLPAKCASLDMCEKSIQLRNGLWMPRLGLGMHQLAEEATVVGAVEAAHAAGYRLFDTASIYKNEAALGKAVQRAKRTSHEAKLDAAELDTRIFVTSKCSPYEMGFEKAQQACKNSLARLGRTHLDLYLIHWPAIPKKPHGSEEHRKARHETWRALETLYSSGLVRAIGVSNFTAEHLKQLLEDGVEVLPMVNQIELHPLFVPLETVNFCKENGILVQAYSPLGGGPASNAAKATGGEVDGTRLLLQHDVVKAIAAETGRTAAQVVLRWSLQQGFAVIPRSCNVERICENSALFDFALSASQMERIETLRDDVAAQKFCWNPSTVS